MIDNVVISSVSIDMAQNDPLPVEMPDAGTAFGPFSIKTLDQVGFDEKNNSAKVRHTGVSYRLSAMVKRLIEQAELNPAQISGVKTGLVSGSSYGCSMVFEMHRKLRELGPRGIDAVRFAQATHSYPVSTCAIEYGLKGPSLALVSCEAAGMEALMCAHDWITENRCERVIVAAYEDIASPIHEHILHSFAGNHAGNTVREAMVLILVERKSAALERGGKILAELTGMATINRNADAAEYQRSQRKALGKTPDNGAFGTLFAHRIGQQVATNVSAIIGGVPTENINNKEDYLGAGGLVELARLLSENDPSTVSKHWFIGATSAFGGGVAAGVKLV